MSEYTLQLHIPYETAEVVFSGSEEDLKKFINDNLKEVTSESITGRVFKQKKIAGYFIQDLDVVIQGPEVSSYIEK